MPRLTCRLVLSLACCLTTFTGKVYSAEPSQKTIVETAVEAGTFQTLITAAKAAGLVETLSGPGPFTVFAPNDEAFGTLPKGTIASLLKPENKAKLAEILTYHVVAGRVYSQDAVRLGSATTVAGPAITITPTEAGANVNGAKLVATDIEASNGVIHVIDRVLLPSDAGTLSSSGTPKPVEAMKPNTHSQRSIVKSMIADAIGHGVPMYNSGDHAGCANLYMNALQSVAAMNDSGLSNHMMGQIQTTIQSCQQMHRQADRAWALRKQMDQVMIER